MSLWRCSQCKKAGLEEDFVFVPIDETHETIYCYECAPVEALKQQWPADEDKHSDDDSSEVR